jgi:hypothetical protein
MTLNNSTIYYQRTLVAAADATDGLTPTLLTVTRELNAFMLWYTSYEKSYVLAQGTREDMIELAVNMKQATIASSLTMADAIASPLAPLMVADFS